MSNKLFDALNSANEYQSQYMLEGLQNLQYELLLELDYNIRKAIREEINFALKSGTTGELKVNIDADDIVRKVQSAFRR